MSTATMPDAVHGALRDRILDQVEAPGSVVTEAAVAARFGVARPTARIAIDRLVADGLLHREPHHAARVPVLGVDDIVDLFAVRRLLEVEAARALAVSGALPAAALAAHRASLDDALAGREFARLDIAFHRALVDAQPSPRLARLHAGLAGEIELCIAQVQGRRLIAAADLAAHHQHILDAIVAGDAAAAAAHAGRHIDASRDALLAPLARPASAG